MNTTTPTTTTIDINIKDDIVEEELSGDCTHYTAPTTTRTTTRTTKRQTTEDEDTMASSAETPLQPKKHVRSQSLAELTFKDIALDATEEECSTDFAGVRAMCAKIVRGWGSNTTLDVSRVSGGITNALFKVRRREHDDRVEPMASTEEGIPKAVVVRVFGPGTDCFITHRAVQGETSYFLNEHGFGAKVLGVFANGLVEEFIEATAVSPAELANGGALLKRVARDLARLHRDVVPDLAPRAKDVDVGVARDNAIWDTLRLWFDMAYDIANDPASSSSDESKRAMLASCQIDDKCRETLFGVVRARCDQAGSRTVYCHNDIHAGNFLFDRKNDVLTLIDYEYADYGPRAFDMANMFCEFAGFECDYTRYPTAGLRREFYNAYSLSEPEEALALENEVAAWTPVTHVFWALWAIIQSKFSSIDFDFVGFAAIRMRAFRAAAGDAAKWVPTNEAVANSD